MLSRQISKAEIAGWHDGNISGGSGVGRSDEELHKNVKGNVKWEKGTQINRPDGTAIKKWLDKVL